MIDRTARLDAAYDPIPAAAERGPVARLAFRHGLDVDAALAGVCVDTPRAPAEFPALVAECHAALYDAAAMTPLARPSPLGREVHAALTSSPSWATLQDAARAHPLVAREATVALANVMLDACGRAGATAATDTRASLASLDAARAALDAARAAVKNATTSAEKRDAMRANIAAQTDVERAEGDAAAAEGIAARAGASLDAAGDALATIAAAATGKADAVAAFGAGCGSGVGVGGVHALSDDVVRALTPEVTAMLKLVGALRKALSAGRAARHVRGREGMIGPSHVGLADVADLTPTALAGLAHLGPQYAALTRLALVEGRADGIAKGGGIARNGDVMLVVDHSGSMNGARAMWAGALALAVILEARADGRTVGLVTFDDVVQSDLIIDSPATLAAAVVALTKQEGGGTALGSALDAAAASLARMPHGGDPADCLVITDGDWPANALDAWPDRARLRGVFIGGSAPAGARLASAWEVKATEGADAMALAVEIASVVV